MIRLVNVYQGTSVAPGAVEFLYQLLAERPAEANISHRQMPTIEQHRAFVSRRPYRAWLLVEVYSGAKGDGVTDDTAAIQAEIQAAATGHGRRVGAVYLTHRNEVGVFILKASRRCGHALNALEELVRAFDPLPAQASDRQPYFVAHVAPGNQASKALFEKLGARLIQMTYELPPRGKDGEGKGS